MIIGGDNYPNWNFYGNGKIWIPIFGFIKVMSASIIGVIFRIIKYIRYMLP
jgi:hypothetical protein